jgi:cation diffusion facilitator CzcD-associated flavoprotein CzcO
MRVRKRFKSIAKVHGQMNQPRNLYADRLSQGFYEKHGISRFTKLSHIVKEAAWDVADSKWKLEVEDLSTTPSRTFKDECDILVNASGFLNKWSWPKIPGLNDFKNPKVHSARWNHALDLKGKNVGLIGNGSSAIQVRWQSPIFRVYITDSSFADSSPDCKG